MTIDDNSRAIYENIRTRDLLSTNHVHLILITLILKKIRRSSFK